MPTVALIDDRKSIQSALLTNFKIALPDGWTCLASAPLADPSAYGDWIMTHDVQVLVIDWVLNEQGQDVAHPVSYKGNVVVDAVRKHHPEMPVFVITAQPADEELEEHLGDVEAVFTRQQFSSDPKKFVKPMIRAGQRFAKRFQNDLADLAQLSAKVAAGNANEEEKKHLVALQTMLGMAEAGDESTRAKALNEFEAELAKLESIGDELREYVKRKKGS